VAYGWMSIRTSIAGVDRLCGAEVLDSWLALFKLVIRPWTYPGDGLLEQGVSRH
jgi:hypothetical protein